MGCMWSAGEGWNEHCSFTKLTTDSEKLIHSELSS